MNPYGDVFSRTPCGPDRGVFFCTQNKPNVRYVGIRTCLLHFLHLRGLSCTDTCFSPPPLFPKVDLFFPLDPPYSYARNPLMSASESTHNTAMPLGSKDSNEEPQLNAHKRPKKPAEVRRRIPEVAQELASTAGAEGVRFSEVAKRADVTTGGIVHHFPNKNALLAAVIEVLVEEMEHDVEDAIGRGEPAPYLVTRVYLKHTLAETNARFAALMRLVLSSSSGACGMSGWIGCSSAPIPRTAPRRPISYAVPRTAFGLKGSQIRVPSPMRTARPRKRSRARSTCSLPKPCLLRPRLFETARREARRSRSTTNITKLRTRSQSLHRPSFGSVAGTVALR